MIVSDEKLHQWNKLGLIPGPDESEEEYIRRAEYCMELIHTLPKEHGDFIPEQVMHVAEGPLTEEAWKITQKLYDIAPTWVPLFFSNHELAPWHGGCAWIFQTNEKAPLGALFQLRRAFKEKKTFLGFYKRDILLAHEAVHVARMAFEEPKFEEFLAYRTSDGFLQKYFGALVETSREAAVFVLSVFIILAVNLGSLGMGAMPAWVLWLNAFPLLLAGAALIRLALRHFQYNRCLKQLKTLSDHAEAMACRMTDEEIITVGKIMPEELRKHMHFLADSSLRWKIISRYLK